MENIQEIELIITLISGTLVLFLLSVVIITSIIKYQKNILKQKEILRVAEKQFQIDILNATFIASDKEREMVARNIHDDLGALINVIKLNNNHIKNNLNNEAKAQELISTNNKILMEINQNIRSISENLSSPTLDKFGLFKALKQLVLQFSGTVNIEMITENDEIRFEKKLELQLFRTCKEVLNNILKHSNSSKITISLIYKDESLSINFNYNARGINDDDVKRILKNNKGLGLMSIFGRVQILGGKINYYTHDENHSSVLISLPKINKTNASEN